MQAVKAGEWRARLAMRRGMAVMALLAWSTGGLIAQPILPLPPRDAAALTGSQFYERIRELPDAAREQTILSEVRSGNVPGFLRRFVEVSISETSNGVTHRARYFVAPDYVAIGSDTDFFRVPMSAPLAQSVADLCSCTLPTRKMVNDIYQRATGKVSPIPFSPAQIEITSPTVWWLSQKAIEDECTTRGAHVGELLAGLKKDIVITPLISQRPPPPRVAIFGWHRLDGKPIQPLSLVHKANYKDYSHGVRLVNQTVEVDGREMSVSAVLADPELCWLLSDEGSFLNIRYPTDK
ncbi:MAG: hypothetical protein ACR2IE_01675 [Candidatus Sumerlaeaceae bacterium]